MKKKKKTHLRCTAPIKVPCEEVSKEVKSPKGGREIAGRN